MFPPTPEVRAFLETAFLAVNIENKQEAILKITDPANANEVAAFAKWIRPAALAAGEDAGVDQDPQQHRAPIQWPISGNPGLCNTFFGTMDKHHEELMADRPHYCMFSYLPLIP